MKNVSIAAVCMAAIVTPAQAKDGSFYAGIEGGLMLPRSQVADANIDYTSIDNIDYLNHDDILLGRIPPPPTDTIAKGALRADWKLGYEVGAFAGYDFGKFRLEVELAHKRAKRDGFEPSGELLAELDANLNRRPPCCGVSISPFDELPLTGEDFDEPDGKIGLVSAMLNGLAEVGTDGISVYAGAGFGAVHAKALRDEDRSWAWQLIAGARHSISPRIDLGFKYRFFQTGDLSFTGGSLPYSGNGRFFGVVIVRPTSVVRETSAALTPEIHDRFQSHSLLATMSYNFGQ